MSETKNYVEILEPNNEPSDQLPELLGVSQSPVNDTVHEGPLLTTMPVELKPRVPPEFAALIGHQDKEVSKLGDNAFSVFSQERSQKYRAKANEALDMVKGNKAIELAKKDELTGLPNRKAFVERLSAIIKRGQNPANDEAQSNIDRRQLSTILLFLDGKDVGAVNDTAGHNFGDNYIKALAEGATNALRDIEVFRIGGDEFAVLLQAKLGENQLPEDFIEALRGRIKRKTDEIIASHEMLRSFSKNTLGISVGGYLIKPGETFDRVVEAADMDMYRDKHIFNNVDIKNHN